MQQMNGKIILITGGASGIGKIMVGVLLARKAKVIIWDINTAKIEQTVSEFSAIGDVIGFTVDISDVHQIQETALKVSQEIGVVDVLINNAGIVAGKYFHEHSTSDILKTMEINASAPMLISKFFIPGMFAQNSGHICNIASSGGLISNPKMAVYAASKWALIGWSDSLRLEMKLLKKNIHVTTVMPYYINTGMFDGVQSKIPILDPKVAALAIIKAIDKKKRMVTLPGYIYRLTKLGQGLLSINAFDWVAGTALGIYKTMEHFTGHKKNS
ncbi:MAG: SDR family oxidoreductase [Polaribacter sp.]|jgi:all-trans-retinol dehydrogenase (NAD+)|tara:strand:+ start:643 stop:1455 length:813 start_codon:yes stop_codon:yes gene_type:complete